MKTMDQYPTVAAQLPDEELARRLVALDTDSVTLSKAKRGDSDPGTLPGDYVAKGVVNDLIERWRGEPPLWKSNAHAFGYISDLQPGASTIDIQEIGEAPADLSLQDGRINVTLNVLRVAEYPGRGTHHILFDFYAQNQTKEGAEEAHFNVVHRVMEGQRAGVKGSPIFVGLGVGTEGISLRCYTVNVKNDDDEKLLAILDSEVFKNGLHLASSLQPAIAPLTGMAVGLTKTLAARHRNIPVQDITLGLDFKSTPGGARLAQGAYVLIQVPEKDRVLWNWADWVFHRSSGQIVNRADLKQLIPFNYVVLGISKYMGK